MIDQVVFMLIVIVILAVAVARMASIVLTRLPKVKKHRYELSHTKFYSHLQDYANGQILCSTGSHVRLGQIHRIFIEEGYDGDILHVRCEWTAELSGGRWTANMLLPGPCQKNEGYFNALHNEGFYNFNEAALFRLVGDEGLGVCAVMNNEAGMVTFIRGDSARMVDLVDVHQHDLIEREIHPN